MSTILTSAIIQGAKDSVDNYVTQITALNGQLDGIMKTLTSTNFTGDASVGYNDFYTQKVLPAITDISPSRVTPLLQASSPCLTTFSSSS